MITKDQKRFLEESLVQSIGSDVRIHSTSSVGGGSINDAACLETSEGRLFAKWNASNTYPMMFELEAKGLEKLRSGSLMKIPEIIGLFSDGKDDYLVLEWIERGIPNEGFWEDFGHKLSELHSNTNDHFGLEYANYIGSLPQDNLQKESWVDFFFECRLNQMMDKAGNLIGSGLRDKVDGLRQRCEKWFEDDRPALIHGDLWNGNFLCDARQNPVLIDPSIYYGIKEMDLGMSFLFGGFDSRFYDAYAEVGELESDWKERCEVCNLYPLLVHVALFGASYLHDVNRILAKYA